MKYIEEEDLITYSFYKCEAYGGDVLELEYRGEGAFWNHNPDDYRGPILYLDGDVRYVLEEI